jgi:hypothetical protein
MFWINGTNDFAYVMASWQKSYRLPRSKRLLSLQVRMKHSHPDGATPAEIFAYAKANLRDGAPLTEIESQGISGDEVWATYGRNTPPAKSELCFTRDAGRWQDRKWETTPATVDSGRRRVTAMIPAAATAWFLNLIDERGLIVSTEHSER